MKTSSALAQNLKGPVWEGKRRTGVRPNPQSRRPAGGAKVIPLRRPVRGTVRPAAEEAATVEARKRPRHSPAVQLNSLSLIICGLALVLCLFGLLMVYSAGSNLSSLKYGTGPQLLWRQALCAVIGMVFMMGLARTDYRRLMGYAPLFLGASILLLALVLIPSLGITVYGSRRFLRPGIQPSELAKLAFVFFLAQQLSRRDRDVREVADILPVLGAAALVGLLIMLEPDLGTTGIFLLVLLSMMAVAGCRWMHLLTLASLMGTAVGLLIYTEPYRFQRLFGFFRPWDDPQGSGFQAIQSMLALGSGGVVGFNLGMSRQKFMYLPNAHNDFIFSIIGEELGFLGTMFVISLFLALFFAGMKAAREAPDRAGRLLAAGITILLVVQALVNMGAVCGVLPITGVTLPLVSYGGTSMVISLASLGILMSIASQGRPRAAASKRKGREDEGGHMRRRNRRTSLSAAGLGRRAGVT